MEKTIMVEKTTKREHHLKKAEPHDPEIKNDGACGMAKLLINQLTVHEQLCTIIDDKCSNR